jgi:hypothetical protein
VLETRGGVAVERLFWAAWGILGSSAGSLSATPRDAHSERRDGGWGAAAGAYLGAAVALRRRADLEPVSAVLFRGAGGASSGRSRHRSSSTGARDVRDGFVDGTLVVPQFVLQSQEHIAGFSDPSRARGKRGSRCLSGSADAEGGVEVTGPDFRRSARSTASHRFAERCRPRSLTNDANLNQTQLRGVVVPTSTKASAPGPWRCREPMRVLVVREGREAGQGRHLTTHHVGGRRSTAYRHLWTSVTSVATTAAG